MEAEIGSERKVYVREEQEKRRTVEKTEKRGSMGLMRGWKEVVRALQKQ